jgi:hypothetical protein
MTTLRAQVTLPYTTGLPEDVATNTLYFTNVLPFDEADLSGLVDALVNIYVAETAGVSFSKVASTALSRGVDACTVDIYDLEDLPPRQPIHTGRFTLPYGVTAGDQDLPHEAAICVSFRGDPFPPIPPARARGRVFMGPWVASVNAAGRPTTAVRTMLANAFDAMWAALGPPFTWVVHSTVSNQDTAVEETWIDNAWDTQRRRGNKPSSRITRTFSQLP